MYATGDGVTRDVARAATLFQRACDGGEARGCYALAVSYNTGVGVTQDLARAATLFRQACDGGYAAGCRAERNSASTVASDCNGRDLFKTRIAPHDHRSGLAGVLDGVNLPRATPVTGRIPPIPGFRTCQETSHRSAQVLDTSNCVRHTCKR